VPYLIALGVVVFIIAKLAEYWFIVVPVVVLLAAAVWGARYLNSKQEQEARAIAAKQAETARIAAAARAKQEAKAAEKRAVEAATAAQKARAAEEARKRNYWRERWTNDVNLPVKAVERVVAEGYGLVAQVEAENKNIESRVHALTSLLLSGLEKLPSAIAKLEVPPSYRAGDPESIAAYMRSVLAVVPSPDDFRSAGATAYSPDSRQLVVEYELPMVKVVPAAKTYRYIKSHDRLAETSRPASQVKSLYAGAIAQLTLLCLSAVFRADTAHHIDVLVFNGVVDTIDPRSGKLAHPCLISVRVTRDTLAEIDLAHVDPPTCLSHLSASVSRSPAELAPVRPLLEFAMVDARYVAETDTLSAMDGRPNLMDLTPNEFESLIQNLFTKMGLETKQTRPSRDGGVDCVAYDTRPIFGGKVVIQAKRYKNTVGVSAVRDLFGTLQNEGASKGILVTTSGYGAASFEFAQNKPIELLDGGNLLYLLEEHAGINAKIEVPDDWRDPLPDAGEAAR
jgi:HJR/Mrr/RecB family endonuclease